MTAVLGTTTRVFGIDPGSLRTGWGVVERCGARVVGIAAGVIDLDGNAPLEERLHVIYTRLSGLLAQHEPAAVAVEDIFYAKYARAALKLGHVRGVALLAAASAGLTVAAYPPALVKRSVAGRGAAEKPQVARIVASLLGLQTLPPLDATDALAVAITHLHASRATLPTPRRAPALARAPRTRLA